MKSFALVLSLACMASASPAQVGDVEKTSCRVGWVELPGYGCYLLNTAAGYINWHEASYACQQQGGHLVEIETQEEQNGLRSFAQQVSKYFLTKR